MTATGWHRGTRIPGAARIAAGCGALLMAFAFASSGSAHAQILLPVSDPAFHKLKYADSLSSVNDRCVITHNRLNPVIHPLYVNEEPVGFC